MGLSLSLERGHEGRICAVLQEDRCSSMYNNHMHLSSCKNVKSSRLQNVVREHNKKPRKVGNRPNMFEHGKS
jgi:hypothetical protein